MRPDRRRVLKSSVVGAIAGAMGALAFRIGGASVLLSAAEARAGSIPFQALSDREAATLEAFGEVLVPGAAKAGIAHYVDSQLAADGNDSLLILRYLDVPPAAWAGFYRAGLAALEEFSKNRFGFSFPELSRKQAENLVGEITGTQPEDWPNGPPAPFFYFVVRADAVDVAYGTLEGYERLGVPYMPHISPETPWKA